MSNPYEAQKIYSQRKRKKSSVVKTMIECLKNRIPRLEGIDDANTSDQPIVFLGEPIPPERCNNYESIIDYILFSGTGYTYRDLTRFSKFFVEMDWSFETTPTSLTPTPLDIFNFFISLPYLVFSFERVIDRKPTAKASSSSAYKSLGKHFKPICFGSHDRNDMERLMNQYYNNYLRTYSDANTDTFEDSLLDMLRSFYSRDYKEDVSIREIEAQEYFEGILDHMCVFISDTSNHNLECERTNDLETPINPMKYIDNYPDLVTKFSIGPDLVIFDENGAARMIIEMKRPPMFEHFNVPPFDQLMTAFHEDANGGHFSTVVDDKLVGMLKQLLVNMVGQDCLRGILTDGYTLILVEIDVSKVSGTPNHIPLRLSTFNCKSRNPSYLQAILYFLMKAALDDTSFNPEELFKFEVELKLKSTIEVDERKDEEDSEYLKGMFLKGFSDNGSRVINK